MMPDSGDTFEFWQGLRGPYYTPFVGEDGYLYWSNNGQLPNPEPVRIVGKDGRGVTLTGQCETAADLPEDPEQGEAWAVGAEEPFECYAWFGEWVDLGLLFPAGQDGVSPAVTITQTSTGHKVKITDKTHPAGQEFDVDNGTPGDPGQDGISPAVTITTTATGHKVKITDRDHPSGQEFNVDNGEDGDPGPGVPAGGSAGQFLRKVSGTDYDAEWYSPAAGDVSYDSSLTYAAGTVGKELSDQRNTLNQLALIGNTTAINQNGTYTKENVTGMTANHKVANWGLFSDANLTTPISPNNPPADITIVEESGGYVITIANYTSAFYMKPTFILPQN